VLNAINGNLTSGGAKGQGSFLLSAQQRQTIADILAKYKDAPYNQDTFNQIQDDLNAAGLGTNTLSMKDQAKSFNPLMVLVNALNGGSTSSSNTGVPGSADEQSKANNFIQGIIQQWQNLLGRGQTTPQDTGADGGDAPADGVTPVESGGGA
jgi:hypothetical protein